MTELREFARHKSDFDALHTRVIAVSSDPPERARTAWDALGRQFTVLSDPNLVVIRKYGILHAGGEDGHDIALRTALLVDSQGRERWRIVSHTVFDTPKVPDVLNRIRETSPAASQPSS